MSALTGVALFLAACSSVDDGRHDAMGEYPWHTEIIATTFWVGEVLDPLVSDGSQVVSTYDANWMENYGGCDGVVEDGVCKTERRTADNDYFPTSMEPKQNPFYLDLPFDDVNNRWAFAMRADVVPWADDLGYAGREKDRSFSYLKNRWVRLERDDAVCYGQIQDAGPAIYDDAEYVFGRNDARPKSDQFNGAGMDVSPALNGCLGFSELNGQRDKINWQFVDDDEVPEGPWKIIVTTTPVVPFGSVPGPR
ncbi:hypothetical protein ACRAJ3_24965 [Rhodococcus pyridinivorans]|uniref:hypothetical protein n=1 Tax=Rhodococcus pyridinivorans TaxID=103816 RepID=UPI003D7F7455